MKKYLFIILIMMAFCQSGSAKLVIPRIIGNNMVLQQGGPVAIWGWADAGETITVQFKHQLKETMADKNGKWILYLDPMKASFDAATLKISTAKESVELADILVGEVWLCSGQSNMEFAMRKLAKLTAPAGASWPLNEVAEATNKVLRIFLVERKKMNPDSTHSGWSTAEGDALRSFSAVGYFFAKEIFNMLQVPVGIISSAIPGSRIEPWMPAEAMASQEFFKENKDKPEGKIDGDPGKFYTTMIEPLIPFTIKGFLWYQGESNCFLNERIQYSYKMKSLIDYWRKQWNNDSLPFYYVQIAPYHYSKATDTPYTVYSEPEFWEAQAAVLKVPNTAMIATIDLNDDLKDLHPVNKWDVGQRLAESALAKTYKVSSRQAMGPVFKSAAKKGNTFIIDFDYKGKGLKSRDGKALSFFEVEDTNGGYHNANAIIKESKIVVRSNGIKDPQSVRFGWREDAKPNLVNSDGLPALSFRTKHDEE